MFSNSDGKLIFSCFKKLDYKDLIIFLIPFTVFLYYLFIFNPGILSYDSFNQLHQIYSNQFTNWHPFFHTFIEMLCIKLYDSPASVGFLQISIFSIIWMVICKFNRDDETDISNKIFILQIIFTLIISLIPINALYSITLWKDILFSYFLLLLCFLIQVMITKKNMNIIFVVIFSVTMAFVSQLRPNGLIIVLILLIILCVYLFKKNMHKKYIFLIPALTIIFILLISSLNVVYDVEDYQRDPICDKAVHILSYYDLNVDMDNADKQLVHNLISENDINDKFNIYFTDPTYGAANKEVFNQNKISYIGLIIKYSFENPMLFAKYLLSSSAIVWDVTRDSDWIGYVYYIDMDGAKSSFLQSSEFNDINFKNKGTFLFDALYSFAYYFKDNIILDTLFNSPALYMYLSFIVLLLIQLITKTKEMYLIYLPNLLNVLTIVVSTPIQANRYLYPNLLIFYLLIIILIGLKRKRLSIF